jgi:hypothetical protein
MNDGMKLSAAFDERRKAFENRVRPISDERELVRCIEGELNELQQRFVGRLPLQDAKLLMNCFEILRASVRTLSAVRRRGNESLRAPTPIVPKAPLGQMVITTTQLALVILLGGAQLGIPWFARGLILLLALLLVLELGMQIISHTAGSLTTPSRRFLAMFGLPLAGPSIQSTDLPDPGLIVVDCRRLCDMIAASLDVIDEILAAAAPAPRPDSEANPFARERPLLEFLQELLTVSLCDDSVAALKKAKAIPGLLLRHGLKAVSHHEIALENRAEFFESFPNPNPLAKQLITERPAFVAGARVELRGRLLVPDLGQATEFKTHEQNHH